jgi:hypothetical protein
MRSSRFPRRRRPCPSKNLKPAPLFARLNSMKRSSLSLLACAVAALVATPLLGRADVKPSFEDDAKPILSQQPGLIEYVEARFQVKETGIAKIPGDQYRPPVPPYIFRARAKGSDGAYNIRLLVQPGAPGHILGVVKDVPSTVQAPTAAANPQGQHPVTPQAASTNAPAPTAPEPPALTSETPSGPITNAPALAPPPDPAPVPH